MRRRDFVGLLGAAAAARPLPVRAEEMRKIGVLMVGENDPDTKLRIAAFQQGLQDLGWQDGRNILIDYRWGAGRPELISQHAKDLVALAPDVIVGNGTPAVRALKPLTRTIPIVCALVVDPVGFGLVESLSRPGGNITGFTFINPQLIGKWTGFLKDAVPRVKRALLLYNPKNNPWYATFLRELAADPQSVALELASAPIETLGDLEMQVKQAARDPGTGLIIGPEAFLSAHMREVGSLTAANRVPGISVYRQFVIEGGLISYGPDLPDIFRRSAGYVDRILKGAKPAELPVQQPTKFEFVINQKAAAALGLTLPRSLLSLADEVIE